MAEEWIYRMSAAQTKALFDAMKAVDQDFDTSKCRFLAAFDDLGKEWVFVPTGVYAARYALPSGMPDGKLLKQDAIHVSVYEVKDNSGDPMNYVGWCRSIWWLAAPEPLQAKIEAQYNIVNDDGTPKASAAVRKAR
jgi:hypothetical protein